MKQMRRYLAVAALSGCVPAFAQIAEPGSPRWFFEVVTATPQTDLTSRQGQQYLQALHAVGRHDLHAALPTKMSPPGSCELWPDNELSSQPVVSAIVALARNTRVVIINEAHDESRHRELIRQLAIALRTEGYSYFAAEAFSALIDQYPNEPFGRTDAGYYVVEPTFGQLIRTVKEHGFKLVPYEHSGGTSSDVTRSIAEREEAQATNLVERIFAADPEAKVLIHVGYSHAAEAALPTFGQDLEWMAARLKAKTGIDPLTVDQTRCGATSDALELTRISKDLPPGAIDVAVAYPLAALFRGRPQWRIDAGDIAVELPETLVTEGTRSLIEARYDAESPAAIPIDRLLLGPGERLPLLLRAGRLRIDQFFEDGRPSRTLVLNVQ